jgi:phosphoglycolate phosphatase (TIGR01487 family)
MHDPEIRGFAVDVDGTIADYKGRIDFEAAATLSRLEDLGYRVVFASGRTAWEVHQLATYLGTSRISVGENGGVVSRSPLDIQILGDISHGLEALDQLAKRIDGVEIKPTMPRFTEVVLKRSFDLDEGRRVLEECGLPVRLIDSTFAYHITDSEVNKGRGLKIALEYLEIEPSEVVAIGDSDTDIPMFEVCGNSIAVGNATEGARKHAAHLVEEHLGAGLVEAIRLTFRELIGFNLEKESRR